MPDAAANFWKKFKFWGERHSRSLCKHLKTFVPKLDALWDWLPDLSKQIRAIRGLLADQSIFSSWRNIQWTGTSGLYHQGQKESQSALKTTFDLNGSQPGPESLWLTVTIPAGCWGQCTGSRWPQHPRGFSSLTAGAGQPESGVPWSQQLHSGGRFLPRSHSSSWLMLYLRHRKRAPCDACLSCFTGTSTPCGFLLAAQMPLVLSLSSSWFSHVGKRWQVHGTQ